MLSKSEYDAQLCTGTNNFDGTPTYNYNKVTRRKMYKDYVMSFPKPFDITATEIQERYDCYAPKLAPLQECTACPKLPPLKMGPWSQSQEGITPMATTTMSGVSMNVTAPPSDTSKMRDYLMSRLTDIIGRYDWRRPIHGKLRKQFNLDAPVIPLTSQEIIDAFKNGKVSIDQKKVDKQTAYFKAKKLEEDFDDFDDDFDYDGISNRYYGVTFTDLPVADRKGYDEARKAYEQAILSAKDDIAVLDPKDGLAALKALENWTPTGKAN